jgi:hypothetical protein
MVLGVIERSENQKPTLLDNKGNYLRVGKIRISTDFTAKKRKKLALFRILI